MKIKKTLLTLIAVTTLSLSAFSQSKPTLKPTGYLSIGYVPERTYFRNYKNELYKEAKVGIKLDFKKTSFETSLIWEDYSKWEKPFFNPKHQKYTFDFTIKKGDFSLFFNHYCFHPVDMEATLYKFKDNSEYVINYTDLTKVGIKYEW